MEPIEICYIYNNIDNIDNNTFATFIRDSDLILSSKNTWSTFCTSQKTPVKIKMKHCKETHKHVGLDRSGNIIKGDPHFILSLVSNDFVSNACSSVGDEATNDDVKLSCTRYAWSGAKDVFINIDNWNLGFIGGLKRDGFGNDNYFDYTTFLKKYPEFKGTKPTIHNQLTQKYKEYVINHEVGHALGRGHYTPRNTNNHNKNKGFPAPIMMQQTKGLYGYSFNTFPLKEEDFNYDPDFPSTLLEHFIRII